MVKYLSRVTIVLCLLAALVAVFCVARGPSHTTKTDVGTNQDQMTKVDIKLGQALAVKSAEIILVSIYGEKVLDERPWNMRSSDYSFV
jgi:hypothetical protein